jgi:hypothetical protein
VESHPGRLQNLISNLEKGTETAMRRLIFSIMLAVSFVSFAKAQETTGNTADEVKKEVLKLEHEKVQALMASGPMCADWFERHEADSDVRISGNGTTDSKAGAVARMRSAQKRVFSLNQYDEQVHVYGNGENGTTAVVSYLQVGTRAKEQEGKPSTDDNKRSTTEGAGTDVWVKVDGQWWFVVHSGYPRPPAGSAKSEPE